MFLVSHLGQHTSSFLLLRVFLDPPLIRTEEFIPLQSNDPRARASSFFPRFVVFVTRFRRQHFTELIHIDECVIVLWFLISGEQRWPTIGEARGVFPLASSRDSSSDPPRADQHHSESPSCVRSSTVKRPACIAHGYAYPFHPFLISSCFFLLSCLRPSCFFSVPRLSLGVGFVSTRLLCSDVTFDNQLCTDGFVEVYLLFRGSVFVISWLLLSMLTKDFWFKDSFPF